MNYPHSAVETLNRPTATGEERHAALKQLAGFVLVIRKTLKDPNPNRIYMRPTPQSFIIKQTTGYSVDECNKLIIKALTVLKQHGIPDPKTEKYQRALVEQIPRLRELRDKQSALLMEMEESLRFHLLISGVDPDERVVETKG